MLGGVLLLLLLLAFVIWRKYRQPSATSPQDFREQTRAEAMAALATCPTSNKTKAATECSIILRRYLSTLTGDPALYETHEEWVARHDSLEDFSDSLKQEIGKRFSQLAQSKYAPEELGEAPESMIENSRQLIDAVHRETTP